MTEEEVRGYFKRVAFPDLRVRLSDGHMAGAATQQWCDDLEYATHVLQMSAEDKQTIKDVCENIQQTRSFTPQHEAQILGAFLPYSGKLKI